MGKKPLRTPRMARRQVLFDDYLRDPFYDGQRISFSEFVRLCDAGDVPGLEPEGYVRPASDTVHGNERDAS